LKCIARGRSKRMVQLKVLMVAEKPSLAKSIAEHLSPNGQVGDG
jgi:hypothetical protein